MKKHIIFGSLLGMILICNQALAADTGIPIFTTHVTNVAPTSVTLNGVLQNQQSVNWNSTTPIFYFEYGTTTSFGTQVNATPIVYGESFVPIESPGYYAMVANLAPNTTYYYRFSAKVSSTSNVNDFTNYYGNTLSFFTTSQTCISLDFGTVTLRKGSINTNVSDLQKGLNTIMHTSLSTDGKFGPLTESVVMQFQEANGLVPDGLVGTHTRVMLHSLLNASCPPIAI